MLIRGESGTGKELVARSIHEQSGRREGPLIKWRYDAEHEALVRTLEWCGNNRTQAARVLQVSRRTLYNKLQEHELV